MRQTLHVPGRRRVSWLWWPFVAALAIATCWVTFRLMQADGADVAPDRAAAAMPSSRPKNNNNAIDNRAPAEHVPLGLPPGRLPQSTGLNVLDRLADQRDTPWKPREAGQSQTLSDALQRAFQYPSFDQLTRRADAEGIFQAAAWALACRGAATAGGTSMSAGNAAKSQISTQTGAQANNDAEMRLRCSDARFATPGFADRKLLEAVAAGQAGAMMVWMQLHPGQWMDAALPDGTPLSDRLFAMAAHGDATALLLLRQHCSRPGACADAVLTRNVLAVLAVERVKGNWPPNGEQSLEGTPDERRRAVTRAAALRSSLPTWRTP